MIANTHIEQRGEFYYITGTRISLDSIVYCFREGCSPESIRDDFNGITLADVYGAISFYLDNQAEIDSYLLEHEQQFAELERQATPPSPELAAKLQAARIRDEFAKQ